MSLSSTPDPKLSKGRDKNLFFSIYDLVFAQYLCLTCCENPGQPNELRLAQPLEAVSVFWYHTAQFPLLKARDPGHLISPIIVFFHSRAGRTLLTYLSRAKSKHLAEVVAEQIAVTARMM